MSFHQYQPQVTANRNMIRCLNGYLIIGILFSAFAGCPRKPPVDDNAAQFDAGVLAPDAGQQPVIFDGGAEDAGIFDPWFDAGEPVERPDCSAYSFNQQIINCSTLDRCSLDPTSTDDLTSILACCNCDPSYCNPPNCPDEPAAPDAGIPDPPPPEPASGCMRCHNGSQYEDYSGTGLSNPHPFGIQDGNISCAQCHGGNPDATNLFDAHVPRPPQIGNDANLRTNPQAYFNFLTRTGLDFYPDWQGQNGTTYTAADYIQFTNPGDLRIVSQGRGCGTCHQQHSISLSNASPIGTETGFFSNSMYLAGAENAIPENRLLHNDTAADYSWRATINSSENFNPNNIESIGEISRTIPVPEHAGYNGPWRDNQDLTAQSLEDDIYNPSTDASDPVSHTNRVKSDSDLAKLYQTQISITCGDCHAGSAGANNRYADFRSSGCTACHMPYSPDGRSRSTDRFINRFEPANPDQIVAPERPHVEAHQIRNIAKILPNGAFVRGIEDRACVGCHQGSNRTVLQYWGVRLDQNRDLLNQVQYPENPVNYQGTQNDDRLFDPTVGNNTFNGRDANQYILTEDYDGDSRDDTPPDIHYERGMGCIDCHGSRDAHAGTGSNLENPGDFDGRIFSRMDQVVKIRCESCHGSIDTYANTTQCTDYLGEIKDCLTDDAGNPLRHTWRDQSGSTWMRSRLDGQVHYVVQVKDVVNPAFSQTVNPSTGRPVYNPKASYAMGRVNNTDTDGIGPKQSDESLVTPGFAHSDSMDCVSCHASWQNNCIGCHLRTKYDDAGDFFSNLTGEQIVMKQENADFTYITPVPMYLGVNSKSKITQMSAGQKTFYAFIDQQGQLSKTFSFSDRQGNGNNPGHQGRNLHPAQNAYQMMAHSIRGRVSNDSEGPRYCVACHNTAEGISRWGDDYYDFIDKYQARDYGNFDFELLSQHIGKNPGNQLNSPFWVRMVAGLGSGLFLFDETGCPVNPLDQDENRKICINGAPVNQFEVATVAYDADRLVETSGVSNVATAHPIIEGNGQNLRDGSLDPAMSGPLGASIINKLTNTDPSQGGKVLDSWLDANGSVGGNASQATGNLVQ